MTHTRIRGPTELRDFRDWWTGKRVLKLIQDSDFPVLVNWAVGVGKSTNLDDVIEAAVESGAYDLVLVLLPTRQVQAERRWVLRPPPNIKVVNLKRRPSADCGPVRDQSWSIFETRGMGLLGRHTLCAKCPLSTTCFWLGQYGKALAGAKVIFANQVHLERDPYFVTRVKEWAGAETCLVLLDESGFVTKNRRITIEHGQLELYQDVVNGLAKGSPAFSGLLNQLEILSLARTSDLRRSSWSFQKLTYGDSLKLQSTGYLRFGPRFHNLEGGLDLFCRSGLKTREKGPDGAISFSVVPCLEEDLLIYSGTIAPDYLSLRLGRKVIDPFRDYRFSHPDTRWYNINSYIGARKFFPTHAPQVLDFFSALIAKRWAEEKRCLLVCKKVFIPDCASGIEKSLAARGMPGMTVVFEDWEQVDLGDPKVIPLINYGVIGINLFQEFHCAYCLTGYYVDLEAVNNILQETLASDQFIPVEIGFEEGPRRRIARVLNHLDAYTNVNELAPMALREQELNVVMQAVGRVRPYTKPREVITFQCDVIPEVPEEHVFLSLGEARAHFEVKTRKEAQRLKTQELVQKAKRMGLTQRQAAEKIGRGLRTVQRYW